MSGKGRRTQRNRQVKCPVTRPTRPKGMKDSELISRLHSLNSEKSQLLRENRLADAAGVQRTIDNLGGLAAYQAASQRGEKRTANFTSARWVTKQLVSHGLRRRRRERLRLLDVGAVSEQYGRFSKWIECDAIDLNPQTTGIVKADFLEYEGDDHYDVIVLSLVLNFVGDAVKRGEMLRRCRQLLKPYGHVFLVLPRKCLENSAYCDDNRLHKIMISLGYKKLSHCVSPKLSFFMYELCDDDKHKRFGKKHLHTGAKFNHFAVCLE